MYIVFFDFEPAKVGKNHVFESLTSKKERAELNGSPLAHFSLYRHALFNYLPHGTCSNV